jgi:hypothetical protein
MIINGEKMLIIKEISHGPGVAFRNKNIRKNIDHEIFRLGVALFNVQLLASLHLMNPQDKIIRIYVFCKINLEQSVNSLLEFKRS